MCSHVNKKAMDQYVNFTEQREELVARHEENRKAEAKIRDLIQTLDLRKDEAIERTFKVDNCPSRWPAQRAYDQASSKTSAVKMAADSCAVHTSSLYPPALHVLASLL
jgi:hypothetical protein